MKLNIGDKVYQPTDIHPLGWGHGKVIEIDDDDVVIHWTTGRTHKYKLYEIPVSIKIDYGYRREKKLKELGI